MVTGAKVRPMEMEFSFNPKLVHIMMEPGTWMIAREMALRSGTSAKVNTQVNLRVERKLEKVNL